MGCEIDVELPEDNSSQESTSSFGSQESYSQGDPAQTSNAYFVGGNFVYYEAGENSDAMSNLATLSSVDPANLLSNMNSFTPSSSSDDENSSHNLMYYTVNYDDNSSNNSSFFVSESASPSSNSAVSTIDNKQYQVEIPSAMFANGFDSQDSYSLDGFSGLAKVGNVDGETVNETILTQQQVNLSSKSSSAVVASSSLQVSSDIFSDKSIDSDGASNSAPISTSELDMKLLMKRERNRVAARKCRDKKLNKIKEYEDKIQNLNSEIRVYQDDIAILNARKNHLRIMLINFCYAGLGLNLNQQFQ